MKQDDEAAREAKMVQDNMGWQVGQFCWVACYHGHAVTKQEYFSAPVFLSLTYLFARRDQIQKRCLKFIPKPREDGSRGARQY